MTRPPSGLLEARPFLRLDTAGDKETVMENCVTCADSFADTMEKK